MEEVASPSRDLEGEAGAFSLAALRIVDSIRHAPYGTFTDSEVDSLHHRAMALASDDRVFEAKTDPETMDQLSAELEALKADIAGRVSTD